MAISTNWTRENIAWAAGLFEGEGSFSPRQNKICLTSTDRDVAARFMEVIGCGSLRARIPTAQQLGKKTQYTWTVSRQEHTQAILAAFWPWLGERRREKVKQFCAHMATAHLRRLHLGEANYKAKLSEEDVLFIRASSEKGRVLARRFGVTETNISSIKRFQTWRHLNGPR